MNVMEIKAEWVLRFAVHLHRLLPSLLGSTASRIGLQIYADEFEVPPEKAAENYVARQEASPRE